jgi:hypothetical protein
MKAMQVTWACSANGGEEKCMQGFGGKTHTEKPLGRSRHRLKLILKEQTWRAWIGLIGLRVGKNCGLLEDK